MLSKIDILKYCLNAHLDYFQPYKSSWPHALVLLTEPTQIPHSMDLFSTTLNDLCKVMEIETTGYDWYTERTSLITLFTIMELYMIQDESENSNETRFVLYHAIYVLYLLLFVLHILY